MDEPSIVIVGAGVVGLSTAYQIINEIPNAKVTIVAESFMFQTTSCGSGGLWEPYQIGDTPVSKVNRWAKDSLNHFLELYHSKDANVAGVQQMTAHQLFREGEHWETPGWSTIALNFKNLSRDQIKAMGIPSKFTSGYTFTTVIVDQKMYLSFLMKKLNGKVTFVQRKVESLNELCETFDAVINASGFGAKTLVPDPDIYPVRGQVLRVDAPWLKGAYFFGISGETPSYLIPNIGSVVVGGTAQPNNYSTTVSKTDTTRIIDGVCELFPALRDAPVLAEWVGLRPVRKSVRLELDDASKLLVHCYGHGGSGVTIGMGCAREVVLDILKPGLVKKGFNLDASRL